MAKISNWDKFLLLLWKNWILQWNHKWQLVIEILLPAIFSCLLVLVRTLVIVEHMDTKYYNTSYSLNNLDMFNKSMEYRADGFPVFTLYYSPRNKVLDDIVAEAVRILEFRNYYSCRDEEELAREVIGNNAFAGIQFDPSYKNLATANDLPNKFEFALRFPSELRTTTLNIGLTWLTNKLFPVIDLTGPRNAEDGDGGIPVGYLREGFLPLQNVISMAYMRQKANREDIPDIVLRRYPYPPYIFDPLLQGLSSMMSLIILLSFIYPCTYITKYITSEKEKQLKEVMKIQGLNNWIHWSAWFLKSFIMLSISALLIVILLKVKWTNDVAVLTYANFSVLFFFLIVYLMASICFCFMMATMFSKASTAAAVTGLIWFIAYIPFSFTINTYASLSLGTKLGWSIFSNTAMAFGIKLILGFEGTGEGFQWNNLFRPVNVDDTLTVGHIIVMMLISCVIYMTICLYVEQIFPGSYGVARKWYFPITREFWCGEKNYAGIEDISGNENHKRNSHAFEAEPTDKHIGLQVKNLKKKFGDKVVVKGISLNMFEDEITVLLGHNGAGKTTTISMLTGMFPPSSGTAIINGSDIRTNIEGARMSLGICPQHNVLFDEMSVANHIRFFSRMKGVKGPAVQKEVNKYLKMIELENKADAPSCTLSGGMKRKLSMCCALCGDTKVVLCDEPSSGMDPAARRQMWDLLQHEKIGRTLLLTTHFMDEADILGDRIAIMCDGELKCSGTSFFLKKQFGSGYRLICVKRENCQPAEVTALLNTYIPGLYPDSDIGAELTYLLPDKFSNRFEEMFHALEEHSAELNLNGYGIGISSMEEVFMKMGAETNITSKEKPIMNGSGHNFDDDNESIQSDGVFSENRRLLTGLNLYLNQWRAMMLKKVLYTWRNKLLLFIQNAMPIFFVVSTVLISRTRSTYRQLRPMTMGLTQYPAATAVIERDNDLPDFMARIADQYENVVLSKGSQYELKNTGGETFLQYIIDLGKSIQVRIDSRYLAAATFNKNGSITAWLNNQPLHTAPLTVNLVHNAMARVYVNPQSEIVVTNDPLPYTPQTLLTQLNMGTNIGTQMATNLCFCLCFVTAIYILFLIKERESRSKLLQFVGGVKVWTFWLTQFIWDIITFFLTALIIVITISCFQERGFTEFEDLARYFLLIMIFGCAVLPFTYVASIFFKEPATGFARLSIVNIFAGLALFIMVVVMSIEIFDTKETADMLAKIFRLFPHFALAMSLNKAYVNVATHSACEKVDALPPILLCELVPKCCNLEPFFSWTSPGILTEVVYMFVSGALFFFFIILRELGVFTELMYYLRKRFSKPPPIPPLGHLDDDVDHERERILSMTSDELANKNLVLDRMTKYYDKFMAVNQVSLCVEQMECFGLLGVNGAGKTTTFKMLTGDERISSGSAYVQGLSLQSDMNNIYKKIGYCPQFDALIDDLTGREMLNIFCLLRGVQAARIKSLSEDLAKSFGFKKHLDKQTHTYSGGNKRKLSTAIAVIGTPSVIYLDEPTTGMDPAARRQLWNMVCRIRDSGKSIVLTSHSMEECEALCTRLAIMVNGEFQCIGSTQHLKNKFSKGLILKIKVRKNREKYEFSDNDSMPPTPIPYAASDISVRSIDMSGTRNNANFRRNSDEISVPEQLAQQNTNRVKEFVHQNFLDSILQEEYQGMLTFYIPLTSILWSQIFGLMERNRHRLNIEDYSISQTTLEEIFLDFAKYQREDPRDIKEYKRRKFCWFK